jgi:hypothetical protein
MAIGKQRMTSSYSVILDADRFILIKDNDDPDFASVTKSADYTVESLAEVYDLSNRRLVYMDTMGRFDELRHANGKFAGFRALTANQQEFFEQLLSGKGV